MRGHILVLLLITLQKTCHSQNLPPFKTLRYEESYDFLAKDSSVDWHTKMKYQPFSASGNVYLSVGGDVRFQYLYFKNPAWGDAAEDEEGYLLTRFLAHADLHTGKLARIFLQLQSSLVKGKIANTAVEENPLDLHQAFVDINLISKQNKRSLFRIGRQELLYGSQRLISVRELPNSRQSFDAVKFIVGFNKLSVDLFYGNYVAAAKGILDDPFFNHRVKLWGGYFTFSEFAAVQNIDLYYLGLWKQQATFDDGTAAELRHSIGTRIWNTKNAFKYDVEAVGQWGNFGNVKISAWTLSFNNSYQFSGSLLKPTVGFKTELVSGNKAYHDTHLQTFNPMFPRGAYFGLAAFIGPANLFDLHPSVALQLEKRLTLSFDCDMFWRYSRADGLYAPNVSLIYSGKNVEEKFIGNQYATDLVYVPSKFLYFRAELTWFVAGEFLKAAGSGKNILFTGFTAQLKF